MIKKAILLIIITCELFLISGCGKIQAEVKEKEKTDFDVYSKVKYSDLIDIENGYISDDKEILLDNIGSQTFSIVYKDYKKHKATYKIDINVVDRESPILSMSSNIYKLVGAEYNLCDEAFYGDNFDRNLKCEIIGNYDKDTLGKYELTLKVSDQSDNSVEKQFNLNVIEKFNNQGNNIPDGLNIADAIASYKNDKTSIGIDVSSYQGRIDWEQVKDSGIEFAMIRLGYGYTSDMQLIIDKYFEDNLRGAKENGLKVGVYFYTYANTLKEIDEQVDFIVKTLNGNTLELGIAYDFESWKRFYRYEMNFFDLNNLYNYFSDKLSDYGYETMLYGSKYYLNTAWNTDSKKIWLAHYTSKTNYDKYFAMWQFSDVGLVNGINGFVDLDVMYLN